MHPPAQAAVFAEGLEQPFGIAFYPSADPHWVYVATPGSVVRYPYRSGDLKAMGPAEAIAELPSGGSHWTRDLAFSPDDRTLFVSVGSATNDAEGVRAFAARLLGGSWDKERDRADVLAFDPDGNHRRVVATGIRNCSGLTVAARDRRALVRGQRARRARRRPAARLCDAGDRRRVLWLALVLYRRAPGPATSQGERPDLAGTRDRRPTFCSSRIRRRSASRSTRAMQFPAEYKGDAFVAFHGSWNRAKRTGYKVVRLPMKDGKPTGVYEDFLIGFVANDESVWGRPVDVAVTKDGALLVTDDGGGVIWRVRWTGKRLPNGLSPAAQN